jgi:adenylate kinase
VDFYSNQNKFYPVDGIGTIAEITQRLSAVIESL